MDDNRLKFCNLGRDFSFLDLTALNQISLEKTVYSDFIAKKNKRIVRFGNQSYPYTHRRVYEVCLGQSGNTFSLYSKRCCTS